MPWHAPISRYNQHKQHITDTTRSNIIHLCMCECEFVCVSGGSACVCVCLCKWVCEWVWVWVCGLCVYVWVSVCIYVSNVCVYDIHQVEYHRFVCEELGDMRDDWSLFARRCPHNITPDIQDVPKCVCVSGCVRVLGWVCVSGCESESEWVCVSVSGCVCWSARIDFLGPLPEATPTKSDQMRLNPTKPDRIPPNAAESDGRIWSE